MNTGLEHLPEGKRRELEFVVQQIRDGFAFAVARRTMPRLRAAKLLKIILFGSYSRGDWVEDPVGRYFSDFDLLVVVNSDELTDVAEFWAKTEERLLEELSAGENLRTPVSIIYLGVAQTRDISACRRSGVRRSFGQGDTRRHCWRSRCLQRRPEARAAASRRPWPSHSRPAAAAGRRRSGRFIRYGS
jgi:predicted nucleotidyltransferase